MAQDKVVREMYDPKKIYNITEEEMRAIQERAAMRDALKKEFQQKVSNPYRGVGGYIVSDLHPVGHFIGGTICRKLPKTTDNSRRFR